jgi:hypothetical protein
MVITSCQLSENIPDVVAPETVIIIKKCGKMNINSYQLIYVQHERPNDHYCDVDGSANAVVPGGDAVSSVVLLTAVTIKFY